MTKILDVEVPTVGESVKSIFDVRIIKDVGQFVKQNQTFIEGDSDKATVEIVSPVTGQIVEILAKAGDEFPVGAVIARVEEKEFVEAPKADAPKADTPKTDISKKVADAPVAPVQTTSNPVVASTPTIPSGGEERVKMTPLRRTIARRLVEAQQTAAMLTTFNEVDMTAVLELRKKYQDKFVARHGIKMGFMSFFVKAVIEGLQEFPAVNAEIDGDEIVYKHYFNIGVAVSGPKGLMVPVLNNADQLSFAQVEQGIKDLADLARNNKLKPEHFANGTFTISNGGVFGSLLSTPILNPPQVGILGMHTIQERPVNVQGKVEIRPMMYLALSYDHRIIDGREAVSFLVRVKELIENPERILFDV